MYDLYETIKSLCAERKTTVSAMCLALGMSKSVMSDLKKGRKKTLSSTTLEKIADYLNVTVDALLGKESSSGSRGASDTDIKFALFGGDGEVTDEMFEEVKAFAEFVKQKNREKRE